MKKSLKLLLATLLVVSLVASLFAQGSGEVKKTEGSGKVKITYWHFPQAYKVAGFEDVSKEYGDWEKYLASEFMKANPDIEVVTELLPWEGGTDKINVSIAGGNPPELVFDYIGRTGGWYHQGAAKPWDSLISKGLSDDLIPSFVELYTIDNKLHAVPGMTWAMTLNINVGLLRKLGYTKPILNGPGKSYTPQEFEAFLKDVKPYCGSNIYPFGIASGSVAGDYQWWGFFWGFGAKLFNPDGTTVSESPEMVEAYKWLLSLSDKGLMLPGVASNTQSDTMQIWSGGKLVSHIGNKAYADFISKGISDGTLKMDYDVQAYPFPAKQNLTPKNAMGATGFVLLTDDPVKQKASAKFVEFVMQPKYWAWQVKGSGQFPAIKSAENLNIYKDDAFQNAVSSMVSKYPSGDFGLSNPNYGAIRTALASSTQSVFAGIATPEKAVAQFLKEVKKVNGK